jgi:AAA family ATPase
LQSANHGLKDLDIETISQSCHGYVGADLKMLVTQAGRNCAERMTNESITNDSDRCIKVEDFLKALPVIKPSSMRDITLAISKVYWSDIGGQEDLKKKLQQHITWPITRSESFKKLGIKAPRGLLMV